MLTKMIAFTGGCWIVALGCSPSVEVQASSDGQGGAGGSYGSSGTGGGTGTTTPGVGGESALLTGTKYTTNPGYSDVVWDTKRNRVFLSTGADGMVRVLDLQSSSWTSISVGHHAEHMYFDPMLDEVLVSLPIKEHSPYWFDADQSGYMAVLDAATLTASKEIHLSLDPWQIVSDGAGYAYIAGASGQSTNMMIVNLTTGKTTTPNTAGLYERSDLQIHPDKSRLYTAITNLSPNTLHRFNIDGEMCEAPYSGPPGFKHQICGELRINPAGTTLYSGCGNVFLTSNTEDSDMTWTGDLEFTGVI